MDRLLPWVAIAAGILAALVGASKAAGGTRDQNAGIAGSVLAVALVYAVAFAFKSSLVGLVNVAHGFAIGAVATLLAGLIEPRSGRSGFVAFGLATAVAGVVLLLPADMRAAVWLGAAVGSGLAAACSALSRGSQGSERLAAFAVAAFAASSVLGSYREGVDRAAAVPALIGVLGVIALVAVNFGSMNKWVKCGVVALILIGGAKLIAIRYLFLGASFNVALGAVVSAAIVTWILENDSRSAPGPFVVCMMIWLAWSTVAFGLLQGLGLAVSALFAAAFLLAAGSYRGLLSMSALVALAFYRIFLEAYPVESKQIDVGQHYAVMGIIAGAALPVAIASWLARAGGSFSGMMKPGVALLAAAITVAVLIAADFVLGSRGTIGILVGLSIAPFVAGLSPGDRLGVLAAIGSLAATVVVTFKFVAPHLLMERETKIQLLGWSIAAAVVLIALAHWLTKETVNESAA